MRTIAALALATIMLFACERQNPSPHEEELAEAILGFPVSQKTIDRITNMPAFP